MLYQNAPLALAAVFLFLVYFIYSTAHEDDDAAAATAALRAGSSGHNSNGRAASPLASQSKTNRDVCFSCIQMLQKIRCMAGRKVPTLSWPV